VRLPFVYPQTKHQRVQSPQQFNDYKKYKPYLRDEFYRICVYCRKPDGMTGNAGFSVEHYRPKSRFPELECSYENLFYCCMACNSRKHTYWPKPAEEKTRYIPNPCDHEMFAHLRYRGPKVISKSEVGEFALAKLDLNDPSAVAQREAHLECIAALKQKAVVVAKRLKEIKRRRNIGTMSSAPAAKAEAAYSAELARVHRTLDTLGAPV